MLAANLVSTIVRGVLQKSQTAAQRNVQVKLIAALFFLMALVNSLKENGKNGETGQSAIHLVLVLKRSEHEPAARQTRLLGKIPALENPLRLLRALLAVVATVLCESKLRSLLIIRLVQLLSVQVDRFLVNLGFDDQTQKTQTPRRSTSLTTCSPS